MRGWIRTVSLAAYYPLTSVLVWKFGGHTLETFAAAVVMGVSIGLILGCCLHAWDNHKNRHQQGEQEADR